jgi:hypothetical protein
MHTHENVFVLKSTNKVDNFELQLFSIIKTLIDLIFG